MISIIFKFNTKSNKNLEFMQSVGSIIVNLRKLKDCIGVDLQQNDRDKDYFKLRLNWQKRELFTDLLESIEYEVLEGAIRVLCEIQTIELVEGQQTITADLHNSEKTSIRKLILSEMKKLSNNK